MGARLGFADVLTSKLVDVPPPAAPGLTASRIASPSWVLRLEPLCVASASVLHMRYPHTASAAPAAGGIPVETAPRVAYSGSQASTAPRPSSVTPPAPARPRTARERLAIQMLNGLGAGLDATATDADVRRAYRRLVRDTHPDRHQGAPSTLEAQAQRLRAVIRAWDLFQGRAQAAA